VSAVRLTFHILQVLNVIQGPEGRQKNRERGREIVQLVFRLNAGGSRSFVSSSQTCVWRVETHDKQGERKIE